MSADLPTSPAGMRAPVMLVDGTFFDAGLPYSSPVPEPWVLGHALARIQRFAGHAKWPTSVAHHSVLVATLAIVRGATPGVVLACLLHDVGEAFVGDIPAPTKALFADEVAAVEEPIVDRIALAYGLESSIEIRHPLVRECDRLALGIEASQVLHRPDELLRYWKLPTADSEYSDAAVNDALRELGFTPTQLLNAADVEATAGAWATAVQLYRDRVRGS